MATPEPPDTDDAQAQFVLGNALWSKGRREEALAHLQRAAMLDPYHVNALNNLGNALTELGRCDEALVPYRAALAVQADAVELHYNLGNALLMLERWPEAEACYRTALELRPEHAGARNNLGNALRSQGRFEEAIECYRQALAVRPEYFGTFNNIGSSLLALHRPDEAVQWFEKSLRLRPDYAEAANNMGGALLALDRPAEAAEWFHRAVRNDPGQVQAQFGEALALLALGDFAQGWRKYESRWLDPRFCEDTPDFTQPPWRGVLDVVGRTVLLHAEQGLGDTLQFVRYAPLVRRLGAQVVLSVQPPLVPLLQGFGDVVIAQGEAFPPHDLQCPLLSLPLVFRTRLETIPADIPYIRADPLRVSDWQRYLGPSTRQRIGIAWSGSADHPDDVLRSIPAGRMAAVLMRDGIELHVAQKDIRDSDAAAAAGLHLHAERLTDFADTAALLACLDLVVSVDTSLVHLASAMGVPTWVLLPIGADFRWLRERGDSPWYPGMRLFRQPARGDWDSVLAAVTAALGY